MATNARTEFPFRKVAIMAKKNIIIPLVVLACAAALAFTIEGCWHYWEGRRGEQKTDDAYLRADMTPLSTRVSGTVRRIAVEDYESVKAGQLLVELNDDDYRAALAEAQAALAAAHAELDTNQATKRIQEERIVGAETAVSQAAAAVTAANAGVDAARADVDRTAAERRRQEALFASKAATRQQLELALADAQRFAGLLAGRQADLERAKAALESSKSMLEAEKRQKLAIESRDAAYEANIQAREAAIVVATVNLGYTKIYAPADGTVGERHVQVGELVTPGKQLLDLVKGSNWVQANLRETQLANIRRGDSAEIRVDTFPGQVLHGKVAEIAPASGSQFALLPPDNATGNFTKVVQRIPVKIAFDAGQSAPAQLRPGLSAVVTIHTSGKRNSNGEPNHE